MSSSKQDTPTPTPSFRSVPDASQAQSLMDGVELRRKAIQKGKTNKHDNDDVVVMPWVGFGTYKMGKDKAFEPTLNAIKVGYRHIDTAFIYSSETTERQVGKAIQVALQEQQQEEDGSDAAPSILRHRSDIFVTTKQWRKYHGYDATLQCLEQSLKRLGLEYIDLWLMHWPGPAYDKKRKRGVASQDNDDSCPWANAVGVSSPEEMVKLRAETWRAMVEAQRRGQTRAIGVSNFGIRQLESLKKTYCSEGDDDDDDCCCGWPPAVNQVECHPLYPNNELRAYCEREGIVFQAYASLGGQDASKKTWKLLTPDGKKLVECALVKQVAKAVSRTPAQVLLRWALQQQCAVIPKTTSIERMKENAQVFDFILSEEQMEKLNSLELTTAQEGEEGGNISGRLCWARDPLRMLDFD